MVNIPKKAVIGHAVMSHTWKDNVCHLLWKKSASQEAVKAWLKVWFKDHHKDSLFELEPGEDSTTSRVVSKTKQHNNE